MEGEDIKYHLPHDTDQVFIKEAIGPYTYRESTYDPIQVLLRAAVPPEKIHLIAMMREPLSTVTGWIEVFSFNASKDTLVQNAITAYETVKCIRQEALLLRIRTTTLVYESFRDNAPDMVIGKLFRELGLPFSPSILSGWDSLPPLRSPESGIFFPPQPKLKWYSGHNIHKRVETTTGFAYSRKSPDSIDQTLLIEHVNQMKAAGVFEKYDEFRVACSKDLGIRIHESIELTNFQIRSEGRRKPNNKER